MMVEFVLLVNITAMRTFEYLHLLAMLMENGCRHTRLTTVYFEDEMFGNLQGPLLFRVVCSFHSINLLYCLGVRVVVYVSSLQFNAIFLTFGFTLAYVSHHKHVYRSTTTQEG